MPVEVLREALVDRAGSHIFSVRLLHEFGVGNGYLNPRKMKGLWEGFRHNPVVFTEEIEGDFERFFDVITDPRTVWFEIFDEFSNSTIGTYSLSDVFPGYEATGHFAYWDRIAAGRSRLTWKMMRLAFEKYNLNRMTAEIPAYQSGTIRAAEALGLRREGVKRQAARRHGKWVDVVILGILRDELEEALNGSAEGAKRHAS